MGSRERAIGMLQAGRSQRAVAAHFGVHEATISRLRHRLIQTGSVADRQRPGQPRVTTLRQDRYIRLTHLRDRFRSSARTARETRGRRRRRVSATTVRRRLKDAGIRCRRPYVGARLTRQHRRNRLNWATAHARWQMRDWRNILFTDETKVMLDSSDKRQHVYRRRGERFVDACVQQLDRWGRGSVMIWAGISYHGVTDLVFINNGPGRGRGLTAQRYIAEVLRPVAIPYIQQHMGMSLLQDNARPHAARATQQYLQAQNVPLVQNWPSMSPDINPIEHCWDYVKRRVRNQRLADVNALQNAVRREWQRIPLQFIRRLVHSMRRRLRAVIAAAGGHTRY